MSEPVQIKNIINKMALRNRSSLKLGEFQSPVDKQLAWLEKEKFVERLWQKDESLWNKNNSGSKTPLGWIDVIEKMEEELPQIETFCQCVKAAGFNHIVLLGMGGSSLAPLVLSEIFEKQKNTLRFTVIDTTEPELIKKTADEINIATLFIVSSKSGNTLEVMALYDYFHSLLFKIKKERTGENFVAITDKNSPLAILAKENNFRDIFINFSDIGGRYSALSYFGIIPAALIGINVAELLKRSKSMMALCKPGSDITKNPGVTLGCALAELTLAGHDKLIYDISPELRSFGMWLEQLIAESTGKEHKGILPIAFSTLNETLNKRDKIFLQIDLTKKPDPEQKKKFNETPSIRISIDDELDIGSEFFRWEIATATAGAILGIDPFDQPNVEESKKHTSNIIRQISVTGKLPPMEVSCIHDSVRYYTTQKASSGQLLFENFFATSKWNDYIVLQAYLPETKINSALLAHIGFVLEKKLRLPVSIQFGPRYLHSTGQFHKGGPDNGFFIQIVSSSENEIALQGRNYTFGLIKKAQAIGDMQALLDHKRRVIMADTGRQIQNSLDSIKNLADQLQPIESRNTKYVYAYNNKEMVFEMSYGLLEEQQYQNSPGRMK